MYNQDATGTATTSASVIATSMNCVLHSPTCRSLSNSSLASSHSQLQGVLSSIFSHASGSLFGLFLGPNWQTCFKKASSLCLWKILPLPPPGVLKRHIWAKLCYSENRKKGWFVSFKKLSPRLAKSDKVDLILQSFSVIVILCTEETPYALA